MSHFGQELERALARHNLSGNELARRTGLSGGQISNWTSGKQTYLTEENFTLLALAITHETREHAELLRAHLLDERNGPGAELIDITINDAALHDRPRARTALEKAWEYLHQEARTNSELRGLIIGLAKTLGLEDKPKL